MWMWAAEDASLDNQIVFPSEKAGVDLQRMARRDAARGTPLHSALSFGMMDHQEMDHHPSCKHIDDSH